ncbi:MAG TPA: regulatory protein RecX [Bacillota bacterium]
MSAASLAAGGLTVGTQLAADQLAGLQRQAAADRAARDAFRLLSFRARSAAELRRRLTARGHDEAAVQQALARLTRLGLVDDASFARQWVSDALARGPAGPRRLVAGLIRRGVDPELARTVAAEALNAAAGQEAGPAAAGQEAGPADEEAGAAGDPTPAAAPAAPVAGDPEAVLAGRALRSRLDRGARLDDPADRRRLVNYLLRRGFSWDAVHTALRLAGWDPDELA